MCWKEFQVLVIFGSDCDLFQHPGLTLSVFHLAYSRHGYVVLS